MKKTILFIFLFCFIYASNATEWIITNSNSAFAFIPANLTIQTPDTVIFQLDNIHNAVEVSKSTWDANGSLPLNGGFSIPFGGGMLTNLAEGIHYYVCSTHNSFGMKGTITVTTGVGLINLNKTPEFKIFNNQDYLLVSSTVYKNAEISMYDNSGRVVKQIICKNNASGVNEKIDIASLKGFYFLRIKSDEMIITRKIYLD